jgi:hypothetical protein
MTVLETLATVALFLLAGGTGVVAWLRWRRWRSEEQDTRLLTGIVDLRRRIREGDVAARLPAKGRGFVRDVETAVNRLLDEAAAHLHARHAEAATLAQALDLLGGVVNRTVAQLGAAADQLEALGGELGRRAAAAAESAPVWDAVERLRAGDASMTGHCRAAAALADDTRSVAAECQAVLRQLHGTLADLRRVAAGATEGVRAVHARWVEVRREIDGLAHATGTTALLAVNAALAAERDAGGALARLAAEADEVAHDATRALARATGAAAGCEEPLAQLAAASEAATQAGRAAAEVAELDGTLERLQDLPASLAALASALSGVADLQAEATTSLAAGRPDAVRFADELRGWTAAAGRIGGELARAAAVLADARRETERLLGREAPA